MVIITFCSLVLIFHNPSAQLAGQENWKPVKECWYLDIPIGITAVCKVREQLLNYVQDLVCQQSSWCTWKTKSMLGKHKVEQNRGLVQKFALSQMRPFPCFTFGKEKLYPWYWDSCTSFQLWRIKSVNANFRFWKVLLRCVLPHAMKFMKFLRQGA